MASIASAPAMSGAELSLQRRRLIWSGAFGTAIEYYDFFLYGFLAPLVFDKMFFPKLSPVIGTIAVLSVYAVGYGARPLGGILFGHFGDRIGRRPVLFITLAMMGISSTLIGLLPPFEAIGIAAPIILVVLRCLQGLAIGGESTGAPVLAMESAPTGKRGGFTGLIQSGGAMGSLLAALAAGIVTRLSPDDFLNWGWRLPYIISIVLVGIGLYVRSRVSESPAFIKTIEKEAPEKIPLVALFHRAKSPLATVFLVGLGESGMVNFFAVFGLIEGMKNYGLDRGTLLTGIVIGNAVGLFSNPGFGRLADLIGRRTVLAGGYILAALYASFVFFPLLETHDAVIVILAMAIPAGILQPTIFATAASFYGELFDDARVRFTGAALGRQLGNAIGGGLLPVVASSLLAATDNNMASPILYYVCLTLISVIAVIVARETRHKVI